MSRIYKTSVSVVKTAAVVVAAAVAVLVAVVVVDFVVFVARDDDRYNARQVGTDVEKCECGTGATCEGPRGGKYCTDGGRKKYR